MTDHPSIEQEALRLLSEALLTGVIILQSGDVKELTTSQILMVAKAIYSDKRTRKPSVAAQHANVPADGLQGQPVDAEDKSCEAQASSWADPLRRLEDM